MDNKYAYEFVLDKNSVENTETSHSIILRQVSEGARILECGPGGGIMTRYLKEQLHCNVTILEVDSQSFERAMQYADFGFCVNLEDDEWMAELEEGAFDYILYADVLEHLSNPTAVLKKMRRFLKSDGHVILSVPNVAYGDIVMNLLRDQFTYTDLGLLDNTHVHLFARNNLHDMIRDAGYFLEYETCKTYPLFKSEQGKYLKNTDKEQLSAALITHPNRYVYQYICRLSTVETPLISDVAMKNQAMAEQDQISAGAKSTCRATCFFNFGKGYTPDNAQRIVFNTSGKIDLVFDVPEGVVSVRFDPLEGYYCVIRNLEIFSNQGFLTYKNINGKTIGELELFDTIDPQFQILSAAPVRRLHIRAEILFFDDPLLIKMMTEEIRLEKQRTENETIKANLEEELKALKEEKNELKKELDSTNKSKAKLENKISANNSQLEKITEELNHYKTHYDAAIRQRNQLKGQVVQWKTSYDVISNSASWKMTKPMRTLLDAMKQAPFFHLIEKGLKCWKDNGFQYTWLKFVEKISSGKYLSQSDSKDAIFAEELAKQRTHSFPRKIKISILVPLYNTEETLLRKMIESCLAQTYSNWELCLADGSDEKYTEVEKICRDYTKKDKRIRYRRLEQNYGIAGNTNASLDIAKGDYIGLCDQDDQLHPSALYEVMRAICEKGADFVYTDEDSYHDQIEDSFKPHFKPDYAPDTLRGTNYIGHFTVLKKSLLEADGKFRSEFEGNHNYDMILRITEKAECIVHVPKILYYAHDHGEITEYSKQHYTKACHQALEAHLKRVGLEGEVTDTAIYGMYRIRYVLKEQPLVSIIIPNYEHMYDLKVCLESVFAQSSYHNFEIIIVENNSHSEEIFRYYELIQKEHDNVKVVFWNGKFNFSAICNFGASYCAGSYLLLLNNDIEIITPDWIQEMLIFAQRSDVGAVGAKLYYPDDTIQHAGVGIGIRGVADHLHRNADRDSSGYMNRLSYVQNLSAVTAACMLIPRSVWKKVGGLDEAFKVAFNDVDLCMRIRKENYLIIWTPFAELYHYESKSRGYEDTPEKKKRFTSEKNLFFERWGKELKEGDPYYNPNFSLDRSDFFIKQDTHQTVSPRQKTIRNSEKNEHLELIRKSEYFDETWYLDNNPDLQGKNLDLAKHFLQFGGFEMRDPSEAFCSEEYYALHEDVKKARVNPLLHYELNGKWENRAIHGFEEKEITFPNGAVETERSFAPAPVQHRRAVVLSCFCGDGRISETLLFLIRGLQEVADQIILIGDCPIFPEELDKLEGKIVYAKFERHEQYDFGSYKRGLQYARENGLLEEKLIDELVFINDSCYGPVYPFSETFDPMTAKKIDFWGYCFYQSGYKKHISSYFLVFKRSILDENLLDQFLQRVEGKYDRGRVIATLETELTSFLKEHGMRCDTLVGKKNISFFDYPVTMLRDYRVPLVKKKAFTRKGKEDHQEALQIIRDNAPELADMIQYKPFVPREHHFPTIEEHAAACTENCKRIAEKVKQGEKVRVLFLVFNATFFPSKPLYNAMLQDKMFDPYIAVIPDRRWGAERQLPGMEACEKALIEDGMDELRLIKVRKDEPDRWPDICSGMDIVCYNSPYNLSSCRYLPRYSMGRTFLPIMVNYGFYRSKYDNKILASRNYAYLWKAFFECEDTLKQYQDNSEYKGFNGEVVGYIKMDPLNTIQFKKQDRIRILVALHHSVEGGINSDLELGNFVRYSDYFLYLPDRYPTVDFVYRPHPHLFDVLRVNHLWGEKKVEDYIATLRGKKNVIWSNGDDYFKEFAESDGCIQDCGSFLVEYLYTGKPCCYMLKKPADIEEKFAPLGKKCLDQCYVSYDTDAIDAFLEKVILEGKDEKAETRKTFAKTVMINYPHAAEAAIESIKRDIFADNVREADSSI